MLPAFLSSIVPRINKTNIFYWLAAILFGLLAAIMPAWATLGLVLAVAVLFFMVQEPLIALFLALLFGPWGAVESLLFGPSPVDSGQLLFFVTVCLWLIRGFVRKRIFIQKSVLLIPLGLFLFVAAISLFEAPSAVFGLNEMLKWVEMGLLMVMTVDFVRESNWLQKVNFRHRLWLLIALTLAAGLSQALLGVAEFAFLSKTEIIGFEHFQINENLYRGFGAFIQPNPYGGYINLNLGLAAGIFIGLLIQWQRDKSWFNSKPKRIWAVYVVMALPLLGLSLFASWSRGAWLGFGAALIILSFFGATRRRWLAISSVIFLGLIFLIILQSGLLPETFAERLTSGLDAFSMRDMRLETLTHENFAVIERLAHWQAAIGMGRDNVWLGVGLGNYEPAYSAYALQGWDEPLGHAHNYYLNLIAEVGFIGTIAYYLFWLTVIGQALWLMKRLDWPQRGIALGLLAAWTTLSVHHLVDKLYVNNIYLHLGVMFAIQQLLVEEVGDRVRDWRLEAFIERGRNIGD